MKTKGLAAFVAVVMVLMILSVSGMANAYFIETFDGNNALFTTTTINSSGTQTEVSAPWSSTGGNLNGNIYATVNNDSAAKRYAFANYQASNVFGDLNGANLTTSFKTEGVITSSSPLVRFYVGRYDGTTYNYFVSQDAFSWDPNNDGAWTNHSVFVAAANFLAWPNQNAGNLTFAQVMSTYNDIGLVFADGANNLNNNNYLGFSSLNGATVRVDNFGSASAVPVPGTLLLLSSGLVGIVFWKKRSHEDEQPSTTS
ncbi:MAG: PEP-CTERM sorting domain-containing protein [Parcubacteria group bacterium]